MTEELFAAIRDAMPAQPWKPGAHRDVLSSTGCTHSQYSVAVQRMIDDGVFLNQKDGVLFDANGDVVDFDRERVDPETMELLEPKH